MGMDLMSALKGATQDKPAETQAPKKETKVEPQVKKEAPKEQKAQKEAPKPEETLKKGDFDFEVEPLEEPKVEEPAKPEENAPTELKPEAQTKWKELRSKADALDKLKPEYDNLKKEVETLKNASTKPAPEVETELNELRQFKAAYDVENTPEYQEAVMKPYQAHMDKIQEVADFAKVPMEKIQEALKEKNALARTRALRAVFDGSAEEVSSEEIGIVVRAADALHSEVFPKDNDLRSKALEIKNSLKGQQEVQTAKQQEAHEAALKTSAEELHSVLSAKLKPLGLFDNQEFADKVKAARPADATKEPMLAMAQATSHVLLPAIMAERNKLATELKEAKAALKARGAAGAGPSEGSRANGQTSQQQQEDEDGGRSLASSLSSFIGRR